MLQQDGPGPLFVLFGYCVLLFWPFQRLFPRCQWAPCELWETHWNEKKKKCIVKTFATTDTQKKRLLTANQTLFVALNEHIRPTSGLKMNEIKNWHCKKLNSLISVSFSVTYSQDWLTKLGIFLDCKGWGWHFCQLQTKPLRKVDHLWREENIFKTETESQWCRRSAMKWLYNYQLSSQCILKMHHHFLNLDAYQRPLGIR